MFNKKDNVSLDDGIGRHKGLKIPRSQDRAGSSPAPGTIINFKRLRVKLNLSWSLSFCPLATQYPNDQIFFAIGRNSAHRPGCGAQ